ncbi:MAG: hypothetical protein NTW10_07775 [Bacteroidetes bacterium]|nr:hypothetical protein [Bacteroidota bacterium]
MKAVTFFLKNNEHFFSKEDSCSDRHGRKYSIFVRTGTGYFNKNKEAHIFSQVIEQRCLMNMKIFSLILIFPFISTLGFAGNSGKPDKGSKYPSVYKEGIIVNGKSSEWENSLFSYTKQALLNYAIVNDSAAFYICVRIADEGAQMKVLRNGIELRFNSRGKKKPEATLHFPIGVRMNPDDHRDRKTMHLMCLLQMQDLDLTGFKNGVNGFQSIKSGKNGVMAAVNWDSTNVMVYEARVPFSVFAQDVRAANPLAVGIVVKGAPKPKDAQPGSTPEGNPTDMQSGRGQDRPGGMRPNAGMEGQEENPSGNMKMYEDDEVWRSIVVAKKE